MSSGQGTTSVAPLDPPGIGLEPLSFGSQRVGSIYETHSPIVRDAGSLRAKSHARELTLVIKQAIDCRRDTSAEGIRGSNVTTLAQKQAEDVSGACAAKQRATGLAHARPNTFTAGQKFEVFVQDLPRPQEPAPHPAETASVQSQIPSLHRRS